MAPVTMPTPELDFGKSADNCVTDAVIKFGKEPHNTTDFAWLNFNEIFNGILKLFENSIVDLLSARHLDFEKLLFLTN